MNPQPDRREDNPNIVPLYERRQPERRVVPRWIEWTRVNEKRGKDLTGRAA